MRLTDKERCLIQAIVDTSFEKVFSIAKGEVHTKHTVLWIRTMPSGLCYSHPIKPTLFKEMKVNREYPARLLLEEEK